MNPNQDNQDELLNQQQKQQQLLRQVEILEATVKQYLTKEAVTRYGTLKAAHTDKALQVLMVLAQLIQEKRITHKLSDEEFKSILIQLQQPKKQFNIKT